MLPRLRGGTGVETSIYLCMNEVFSRSGYRLLNSQFLGGKMDKCIRHIMSTKNPFMDKVDEDTTSP